MSLSISKVNSLPTNVASLSPGSRCILPNGKEYILNNSKQWIPLHMLALEMKADLTTENLNSVTSYGIYLQNQNVNATVERNYPSPGSAGILKVFTNGNDVYQEFQVLSGQVNENKTYTRGLYGGVWSSWLVPNFVNFTQAEWNTVKTNSHTHSNKANLDSINQDLNRSSSVIFDKLFVNNSLIFGANAFKFYNSTYESSNPLTIGNAFSTNLPQVVFTGGLVASDNYASDGQYLPLNGIYSKGVIKTENNLSSEEWKQAHDWGNHATAGYLNLTQADAKYVKLNNNGEIQTIDSGELIITDTFNQNTSYFAPGSTFSTVAYNELSVNRFGFHSRYINGSSAKTFIGLSEYNMFTETTTETKFIEYDSVTNKLTFASHNPIYFEPLNLGTTGAAKTLTLDSAGKLGYINGTPLMSFTETDPTVPSHVKAITQTNLNSWNSVAQNYLGYVDDRIISPNDLGTKKIQFGFTSFTNNNTGPWADFIHFGGYQDAGGGNQNLIVFNKTNFGIRQYQGTFQSGTSYNNYVDYWHSGNFNPNNYITKSGLNIATSWSLVHNTYQQSKFEFYGWYPSLSWDNSKAYMSDEGIFYIDNAGISQTSSNTFNVFSAQSIFSNNLIFNVGRLFNPVTPTKTIGALHLTASTSTNNYASSITFSGQPNTWEAQAGIYVQGSGAYGTKMYFATTNSYADGPKIGMILDSNGNVGIGTTSPSEKLEVNGNVRISNSLYGGSYSSTPGTSFSSYNLTSQIDSYGSFGFYSKSDIDSDGFGYVNMSADPEDGIILMSSNLASDNYSQIHINPYSLYITNRNSSVTFKTLTATSSINSLTISSNGKVGIGLNGATESLEVNGYVKATGFKTPTGSPSQFLKADGSVDSNTYALATGTNATGNWGISITGNASTATKLQTARTLTIGATGKTFDGSANVAWSLGEIGAMSTNHVANSISSTNINNWNAAHGWGNHSGLYLPLDINRPTLDLNTLRTSCIKGGGGSITNPPPGSYTYSPFMVLQSSTDRFVQLWFDSYGGNSIHYRAGSSTTWDSWKILWHSGNFDPATKSDTNHTHTFASLTSKPTTIAGYGITDAVNRTEYKNFGEIQFGTGADWTTTDFINYLTSIGFFNQSHSIARGVWSYAGNSNIVDAFGGIELAGTIVESFSNATHKTIRITCPTTSTTPSAGRVFVYNDQNNGTYSPGWREEITTNSPSVSNWNTAFGWNNHATQGYLKSSDLSNYVTTNTNQTITGHKEFQAASNTYYQTSLQVKGNGTTILPGIGFHQPGIIANQLNMSNDGWFQFVNGSNTGYANLRVKNIDSNGMLTFGNNEGGVYGVMGDNDSYRIWGRSTSSNQGYLEISTADDGNEPIIVSQYTGQFINKIRQAVLLDESGNTSFPGTVTATGFKTPDGSPTKFLMADGSVNSNTYAKVDGTNATDNWSNTSSGLSLNPTLPGKTLNASGQNVSLKDATYGQISGIVQDSTNGPRANEWSNRLKTLHNNSQGYFTELAQSFTGVEGVWHRRNIAGNISSWKQLYDDSIWNAATLSYSGSTLTLTINGIQKTTTINAGSGVSFTGSGSDSGSLALRKSDGTLAYHTGIYNTGSSLYAAAFYETSLKKYKTNIEQFDKSGIELLNELDIVTFDKIDGPKNKIGIIADNSPKEFLSEKEDAVDLYNTIFIQAKAIQELSDTNDMLQARIGRLEEEIQNLRDLLILKLNK